MKLVHVLPFLLGLIICSSCRANCDCVEEIRKDPVFFMQKIIEVLREDTGVTPPVNNLYSVQNDPVVMSEIIKAVRQDLVKNPKILQEMANAMQEQQASEKNDIVGTYIRSHANQMMVRAPILGNRNATKTIFIWADFSCPYCRRVHGELARVLKERNDVRVVIKNFSIHGDLSDGPAKAAVAAKMQDEDKAAKLVDLMMTREFYDQSDLQDRTKLAEKVEMNIMKLANEAGLDTNKLKEDMKSDIVLRELAEVRDLARTFEINGTPYLIIKEKAFPGAIPYKKITEALDE